MEKSKLISVLKSLDKKELKRFEEFINSPYYNKNKNIKTLLEHLMKYYPEFENKDLSGENVFRIIFPKENYDYHKLSNLTSDLYQLSTGFLKVSSLEKDETGNNITLLEKLYEKKLVTVYNQMEKQTRSKLDKSVIKTEDYYFLRHRLNRQNTSHNLLKKNNLDYKAIQTELDGFLSYSLIGLMRLYSKVLHNKNHGEVEYSMDMFEVVREYTKTQDFRNDHLHMIYKNIISLELSKEETDYKKLLNLKDKFKDKISDEDMHNILIFLNSFVAYRLNKFGDESYYKDRFKILSELVSRNFITPARIAFTDFTYIFSSACTVGEFEWAEQFKIDFQNGISPAVEKQNAVIFCTAYLNYIKEEYSQALENFSKTGFSIFFMKVTVKSLMIRIFYETSMYEQFLSAVDSFRHYLKREKLILEEQKKAHYDFLVYTSALFKMKIDKHVQKTSSDFLQLKKEISGMDNSAFGVKSWLLKKAGEFV